MGCITQSVFVLFNAYGCFRHLETMFKEWNKIICFQPPTFAELGSHGGLRTSPNKDTWNCRFL